MTVDPNLSDETGIPLEKNFKLMRGISSPVIIAYG